MKKYLKIGLCLISFGASIGAGMILEKKKTNSKTLYCGSLRIDQSEKNEPPKLFLELEVPIEYLKDIKIANVRIINENYICAKKTAPLMDKTNLKEIEK